MTKVIYLPDPRYQELAVANVETLVSTRLEPGVDPVLEADKRGTILLIVRLGGINLEMDAVGSPVPSEMMVPGSAPTNLPPGMIAAGSRAVAPPIRRSKPRLPRSSPWPRPTLDHPAGPRPGRRRLPAPAPVPAEPAPTPPAPNSEHLIASDGPTEGRMPSLPNHPGGTRSRTATRRGFRLRNRLPNLYPKRAWARGMTSGSNAFRVRDAPGRG